MAGMLRRFASAIGLSLPVAASLVVASCGSSGGEALHTESDQPEPKQRSVVGMSAVAKVTGPPGFVSIVDGEPIVVSLTDEHTLTTATITGGDYSVTSSSEFDDPIAGVEVASGRDAGLVAVLTCEVRHNPTDADMHVPCDTGPEMVIGSISSDGSVDFESFPTVADQTGSAVGWIAANRPYLFTGQARLVLSETGDRWADPEAPPSDPRSPRAPTSPAR